MKAFAETEKAVKLEMVMDFYNLEKSRTVKVWIPKSQIVDGMLTAWIADQKRDAELDFYGLECGGCLVYFYDAENNEIAVAESAAFKRGQDNYQRLIDLAKANGVKGVRVGLRRATIESKLTAAGVAF